MNLQLRAAFAVLSCIDSYFVVFISWSVATSTTTIGAAGLVLLSGHISSLFTSRIIGASIDRRTANLHHALGFLICGVSAFFPIINIVDKQSIALPFFIISSLLYSLGRVLALASLEVLQHSAAFESQDPVRVTAAITVVRQCFLLVGAAFGGIVLHYVHTFGASFVLMLLSLLGAWISHYLPYSAKLENLAESGWSGASVTAYIGSYPSLALAIIVSAVTFSVAQLLNSALPYIASIVLKGNSLTLSVLEGAWAIGGIITAFFLSRRLGREPSSLRLLTTLFLFSALSAATYMTTYLGIASLLFFIMGLSFSMVRIGCDARIFGICRPDFIARVRMVNQQLISAFGIVIYSAPTIFQVEAHRMLFYWGGIVALVSLLTVSAKIFNQA